MRVAVSVREGGSNASDIWVFDVASGIGTRVTSDPADDIAPAWSSDGRRILFASSRRGSYDIYEKAITGTGEEVVIVDAQGDQIAFDWSSDGRWVAYTSVEGGREDVFALRFPRPGGRFRVSARGGSWSRWGGAGREVFYLDPDNRMMAVAVKAGSSGVGAGLARPLFQVRARPDRSYPYDVTADGQRVLVNLSP